MSATFAERGYHPHDMTPIGDTARRIASYTEGAARLNVYKAARDELAALTARATAAEAENARLRKGLVGIQNAAALVVENDKPDRVKWDGEWHEGPLATAYIQTVQAIGQLAHSALEGEHER